MQSISVKKSGKGPTPGKTGEIETNLIQEIGNVGIEIGPILRSVDIGGKIDKDQDLIQESMIVSAITMIEKKDTEIDQDLTLEIVIESILNKETNINIDIV